MANFNKAVMVGNLTRNCEVRYVPGKDLAVGKFGLAVNQKSRDKEETCFIDIVTFGKTAEFCGEYATKGMPVLVEGRLSYNTWEQDGERKSKHEIIAENVQLLGKREKSSEPSGGGWGGSDEDEPPF